MRFLGLPRQFPNAFNNLWHITQYEEHFPLIVLNNKVAVPVVSGAPPPRAAFRPLLASPKPAFLGFPFVPAVKAAVVLAPLRVNNNSVRRLAPSNT